MLTEEMIPADTFCTHHNIELSFIYSLKDSGLVEINIVEEKVFVPVNQLAQLEKLVTLYQEMDINVAGIETISYLLQRINDMQQQLNMLTNRLRLYENE
jgi:chaperone modulatory protein CbpM